MLYKNNPESERLFFKKWLSRLAGIYAITIACFSGMIILSMCFDESLRGMWAELVLPFGFTLCMLAVMPFLLWKKVRKNYRDYSFEITDDEIIACENGLQKRIAFSEITKIVRVSRRKLKVCSKSSVVYTPDFVDGLDGLLARLAEIREPETERRGKLVSALSWFFIAGFFVVSHARNEPLFVFFGSGFIVMAVIGARDYLRRSVRPWMKAYVVLLYGFFIVMILWNFARLAAAHLGE